MKRFALVSSAGLVGWLYQTFIAMNLWNWFATKAFHSPEISFWGMFGIVLLVSLFTSSDGYEIRQRLRGVMLAVMEYMPEDKREAFEQELQRETERIWLDTGTRISRMFAGWSLVLALGFAIHMLFG